MPTLAQLNQRYAQLLQHTQELPQAGSRGVTVCGHLCGWATAQAAACLANFEGVHLSDHAVHIAWAQAPGPQVDALLARIAQHLNTAGLIKSWRGELLNVMAYNHAIAAIERGATRPLGFITQAVHLHAWSPDHHLWVAKRAASKATDPNMWDTLVGGLAVAFEDLDTSLLRESEEEAGLVPAQLDQRQPMRCLMRMHRQLPEGYQVEDVLVSDCILAADTIPHNKDGEVSEIRLLSIPEWWQMTLEGAFTLEAELVLIDSVRTKLNTGILLK